MENKLNFWTQRLSRRVSISQMLHIVIWDKSSYPIESSADQKLGGKYSQSENTIQPLKRLPYLHFVFILLSGFAVAVIGVKVLTKPMVATFDPFSVYMDIFPGQPKNAVETKGFVCRSADFSYYEPSGEYCTFTPAAGIISTISVTVSADVIHKITFTMRDESLDAGDLLLLTEARRFHIYPKAVFILSTRGFVRGLTSSAAIPSIIRPVWSVTFTDAYVSK